MYFFIFCGLGAFYTLAPESYPTDIRGVGMAFVNICARAGGIVSPIVTGLLLENDNGFQIAITSYSVVLISVCLYLAPVKETKTTKVQEKLIAEPKKEGN